MINNYFCNGDLSKIILNALYTKCLDIINNLEDYSIVMFGKYVDTLYNTKIMSTTFTCSQNVTVLDKKILYLTATINKHMWKLNYIPNPVNSELTSMVYDVCRQYNNHFPYE